jgi:hypothetical protein
MVTFVELPLFTAQNLTPEQLKQLRQAAAIIKEQFTP